MKSFCTNCGKGVEYASARPNFCPVCGTAFGGAIRPVVTCVASVEPAPFDSYDEEPTGLSISPGDINLTTRAPNEPIQMQEVFGSGSTGFGTRQSIPDKDVKKFVKKMMSKKAEVIDING